MRLNAEIVTICVPVAVPISFYLNTLAANMLIAIWSVLVFFAYIHI